MTNELEKQFFDTFGIEPKLECIKPSDERCNECGCCELKYPQITDTHYLQLLCLLAKGMNTVTFFKYQDINNIKDTIVYGFILGKEYFTKHQVQALFGGND